MAQEHDSERVLTFRCGGCRLTLRAMAFHDSPFIAKVKCRQCGTINEVQTRESAWREIDEHKERSDSYKDHQRRQPSSIHLPTSADVRRFG